MTATAAAARQTLSVVVIGRNEGERLRRCLESVAAMERGEWEVELIYVDSGSTDGSLAVAESFGAKTVALRPERPTAALARNAGCALAEGDVVLFLDGDTIVDANFARDSMRAFDDPKIAVVWGHRRELHPEASVYNRVLDLDWVYAPGIVPFCGGDALMRREVLVALHGFDAKLIAGEEPELCRRMIDAGYLILHVDRPMTMHDLNITRFAQYWSRAMRAGHAFAEVSARFAHTESAFWSADAKRNRERALTLVVAGCTGVLASVVLRSVLPLLAMLAVFASLALRTAWKARWKSRDAITLLLYGVHSHLQQIPIFWGQVRYRRNQRAGVRAGLVEYKRP